MQTPATISFRNFPRSEAVASRIEEKICKLEQYYDRIISCRVVVQAPHRHNTKGKLYQVHIHLGLPGDDIVVGKDSAKNHSHEDVYIAVRDSFEALRRQLKKHVRQIRNRHVMSATDPVYDT